MLWLAVALALGAMALAGVVYTRRRMRRAVMVIVPQDLPERVVAATRAFTKARPWQPSKAAGVPETAAAIEAALIARDPRRALELVETALASRSGVPSDGERVWLGWVLCANSQPTAALDQLAQVRDPERQGALGTYVRARAEHLKFEHAVGAVESVPPIVTVGDLAVVTLART
jgi:hypothetical protein